jgi:hypothetical protein
MAKMATYQIFWLTSIAFALLSAVGVIALGCYLLRKVVEDSSNSTTLEAYVLRSFRVAPGLLVVLFGCTMALLLIKQILYLALPQ